jgi:hypothetical protein
MLLKRCFLFLLVAFITNNATGQKNVINQNLYWVRYYGQMALNQKMVVHTELDNRWFFEKNCQQQFIGHLRLHYNLNKKIEVGAGIAYLLQSPQIANSSINFIVPEYRLQQEINFTPIATPKFTFSQRLRVDERFVRNADSVLRKSTAFAVRFRYRLQATYAIKNSTIKLSNEFMAQVGKAITYNQFDQNRVYLGIEQKFNTALSAEIGYLYLYQKRNTPSSYFSRNIIRATFYHRFNYKRQVKNK